jgi:hypothetical protein
VDRLGAALVARQDADHRREVAAGALAGDRDPLRVAVEEAGVLGHVLEREVGVVDRRRERVLGRLPVGDRDDDRFGGVRQGTARGVVGVEVGDDEAATVEVDDHRERRLPLRRVDPADQVAVRRRDRLVLDVGDRLERRLAPLRQQRHHGVPRQRQLAGVERRLARDRDLVQILELLEDLLHLGVEARQHPLELAHGRRRLLGNARPPVWAKASPVIARAPPLASMAEVPSRPRRVTLAPWGETPAAYVRSSREIILERSSSDTWSRSARGWRPCRAWQPFDDRSTDRSRPFRVGSP